MVIRHNTWRISPRIMVIGAWLSLARALEWGSRGRQFKSVRPDIENCFRSAFPPNSLRIRRDPDGELHKKRIHREEDNRTLTKKEEDMEYEGPERRKFPRVTGRFIVSYRILDEEDNVDISQTKDISLGGMYITTNRSFEPGTNLALEIRLPFDPHPIMLIGKVVASYEVTRDLIYDTRLEFLAIDENHRNVIGQTVDYYQKKGVKHEEG